MYVSIYTHICVCSRPNKQPTFFPKSTPTLLIHFKLMFSLFTLACVPLHTRTHAHSYTQSLAYSMRGNVLSFRPPICVMACLRLTNTATPSSRVCLLSDGARAHIPPAAKRRKHRANPASPAHATNKKPFPWHRVACCVVGF